MKYIIERKVRSEKLRWEGTYWTDSDVRPPARVSYKEAQAALQKARSKYPNESYRIAERKE